MCVVAFVFVCFDCCFYLHHISWFCFELLYIIAAAAAAAVQCMEFTELNTI